MRFTTWDGTIRRRCRRDAALKSPTNDVDTPVRNTSWPLCRQRPLVETKKQNTNQNQAGPAGSLQNVSHSGSMSKFLLFIECDLECKF